MTLHKLPKQPPLQQRVPGFDGRHGAGFSLLELAIAMVILSLLMAWLMAPLRAQRSLHAYQETEARLRTAQQSLIGHALIHHYLPCPDDDQPPDGWENVLPNLTCRSDEGVLPWLQLSVPATDAWGRYILYRVDSTFSHHGVWFNVADAELASNLQVMNEAGAVTSVASRPVAVLLSHGENGLGGIQSGAQAQPMPMPQHPDELENVDGDSVYVDKAQSLQNGQAFDDRLLMLSPKSLIFYMVAAQRLP